MKLLTEAQVAEMLACSAQRVRRLPIPRIYLDAKNRRGTRYKLVDVEKFIADGFSDTVNSQKKKVEKRCHTSARGLRTTSTSSSSRVSAFAEARASHPAAKPKRSRTDFALMN